MSKYFTYGCPSLQSEVYYIYYILFVYMETLVEQVMCLKILLTVSFKSLVSYGML